MGLANLYPPQELKFNLWNIGKKGPLHHISHVFQSTGVKRQLLQGSSGNAHPSWFHIKILPFKQNSDWFWFYHFQLIQNWHASCQKTIALAACGAPTSSDTPTATSPEGLDNTLLPQFSEDAEGISANHWVNCEPLGRTNDICVRTPIMHETI